MVSHNMEMRCLQELKENGYEAFVPLVKRWTKPSRKKKPVQTTSKIFPGYVFLQVPEGSRFSFLKFKRTKVNLLYTFDEEGEPVVSEIKQSVILEIIARSELGDLFEDFDRKNIRASYDKNQLVCWRKGQNYSLGFIARNTQGRPYAHIKIAGGVEAKISVALLSLL